MTGIDAARMLRRRLSKAAAVGKYSPHSFRATGLTRFLEEGGTLEAAQNEILDDSLTTVSGAPTCSERLPAFESAGPRRRIFFDPAKTFLCDRNLWRIVPGY